jgi:hypothetical protein
MELAVPPRSGDPESGKVDEPALEPWNLSEIIVEGLARKIENVKEKWVIPA